MAICGMPEKQMQKAVKWQNCAQCGSRLEILYDLIKHEPYLACHANQSHEGIAREYQKRDYNIATRRDFMEKQIGIDKFMALEKYSGLTSLTKTEAQEIINTVWPEAVDASPAEVYKAIKLCVQYQLNPLARHLFLIPFWNTEKKRYEYICVKGIGADRLVASRKHHWSWLDDTPRIATEEEEKKHYRAVDPSKLRAIAKIKDLDTGAEMTGWGEWPLFKAKDGKEAPNEPKGIDKGNSKENMACIHAERKALDMMYPADMPAVEIPTVDERYVNQEINVAIEPSTEESPVPEPSKPTSETEDTHVEEPAPAASKPTSESPSIEQLEGIDMGWVMEQMKILKDWKVGKWLREHYPKAEGANVREILRNLTVEQRREFGKEIEDRLQMR